MPWTQTSAGGAVTQYHYYADGDLYSSTSPTGGMLTQFTYDQLGRPVTKTETYTTASGCAPSCPTSQLTTTTAYDGLNRAVTVTAPATTDRVTGDVHQAQTSSVYDVDGNQVSQTVSDVGSSPVHDASRTTLNHYNSHDQVDWSMDAQQYIDGAGAGGTPNLADATQYSYDAYGNKSKVVSAQDQNGRSSTTDLQYDADGRLIYTTLEGYTGSPSGSQSAANQTLGARTYDPAGRLASVSDAMGFTTFYQYYDDNLRAKVTRCQTVSTPSGGGTPTCTGASFVQESDSYDAAGDLTASVTNNGTTETDYAYDAAGRQDSSTLDPHGLDRTTSKTYNADDLVVSQRTGDAGGSGTTDYQYNADGAMTAQSVEDYTTGAPSGWWKLNDGAAGASTPATAHDWSGQNNTGALSSGVSWAAGAASFNGTSGVITTASPVLSTTASYSISAWVNLASTSQDYQTLIGQSAADGPGDLYLEYSPTFGGWSFILQKTDSFATGLSAYDYASSNTGVAANTWTHLVAVYDSSSGAMQLYVNGALAATATDSTPFQAGGRTSIGAVATTGGSSNYTDGQVANVQMYQRALSASDVTTLYGGGSGRTGGALSASSNTTTWALDGRDLPLSMTDANGQSTDYVYDESGRRAVTEDPAVTTGIYTPSGGYATASVTPTATTGYDTFGDAVESKDPTGIQTVTTFDADGRPTATKLPDYQQPGSTDNSLLTGEQAKTQYNELGQKTATWDPAGIETTYGYDQLGHLTTQTQDPGGLNRTASTAYDLDGDPTQVTDPSGAIRSATYDYLGRTLSATQVLGLGGSGSSQIPAGCQQYNNVATQAACTSTYAYTDTAGFLSRTTSPGGVTATYGYDAIGERTSVTDGANQTTSTGYDYAGRAIKTTMPDGTYSTTTYDQAGQVTAQAQYDASGTLLRSSSATYDADGNVLSSTDPNGNTTHFTYDATGQVTGESQPASYTSTLAQVPSVTQTITTSFGYDAAGRRTEYVTGNGNHWYTTYNSRGLPETSVAPPTTAYTSAADSTTTLTYDADGRPIEQDAPGGVTQTQSFDNAGEVLTQSGASINSADAASATRSFTYYPSGLMKTAATSNTATSGSNATSESFTYDDSGALASAGGTAGSSAFTYTADGQMATRTDTIGGTAYTTSYGYDTAGRLATIADPLTGSTLTYAYTPNALDYAVTYGTGGDVRSLHYNSAHELVSDTLKTAGGATVTSIGYGYDPNGNETSNTTTGFTDAATNTYTYDQANRLKSWSNGATVTGYAYDQDSNRTNVAGNTYTYDARDQLTSDGTNTYAYTARGTLQTTTSATGTATTSADAYGQIRADASATYTYDALGRLVASGSTALDYTGTGNTISYDGYTTYSRDPSGALLADMQPGYGAWLDMTDQHNDVVAYFGPTSLYLAGSAAYDPLGNVLSRNGHSTSLGYQSEYTSQATGKVNMAARWYNPATGQFTSKDTATNNPVPNSANANPFAYGNDNPLTNTDPSGHRACGADGQCFGTTSADFRSGVAEVKADQGYWKIVARHLYYAKSAIWAAAFGSLRPWDGKPFNFHLPSPPASVPGSLDTPSPTPVASPMPNEPGHSLGSFLDLFNSLLSGGVGMIAGLLCEGATDGVGTEACAGVAGAATGLAQQGIKCIEHGGQACSGKAFVAAGGEGGLAGLALGGVTSMAGDLVGVGWSADSVVKLTDGLDVEMKSADALVSQDQTLAEAEAKASTSGTDDTQPTTDPSKSTQTKPQRRQGTGASDVANQPSSPVTRMPSPAEVDPAAPDPVTTTPDAPVCHSFIGSTPILMSDGTTKPIDQIHVGDKITNATPGGGTETHTVDKVIVTTTDHDFAALTIAPVDASRSNGSAGTASTTRDGSDSHPRARVAGAAMTAALILVHGATSSHSISSQVGDSDNATQLTTTYHHEFYDATTNQWTQAENLRSGDLLQTPTGYALLEAAHLYHANTITYDLTIGDLHTYYVVAGSTPVLVHNCGNAPRVFAVDSSGVATALPVHTIDSTLYPDVADNFTNALANGESPIVTRLTGRAAIRANRAAAQAGIPRPGTLGTDAQGGALSWEEFPFASTQEGGAGATLRLINRSQNISHGRDSLWPFLRDNGIDNGDQYYVQVQ